MSRYRRHATESCTENRTRYRLRSIVWPCQDVPCAGAGCGTNLGLAGSGRQVKTLLAKLKSALAAAVNVFRSGEAQKALDTIIALVPKAMPIVRVIASLTPTMADNEILALLDSYNLLPMANAYLALPVADRGPALQHAAATALASVAPGASRSVLNAAVELAVTAMKTETA